MPEQSLAIKASLVQNQTMFKNNEHETDLNTPVWVQAALDAIARRGLTVHVLAGPPVGSGFDFRVQLAAAGVNRTYDVLTKVKPQIPTIKALHDRTDRQTLLVTPHITPGVAAACRNLKIHFADSAGNMFFDWGTLLIDVQGERPLKALNTRPAATEGSLRSLRSFRSRGLMVIFSLLSVPQNDIRTYRTISEISGASLGTVQAVMEELGRLGYLEKDIRPRRLHKTKELFDRWVNGYLLNLEPKLLLGRYYVDDLRRKLQEPLAELQTAWGGEAAAALLDPHLRPSTLVVYSPTRPTPLLARWKARNTDPDGNVLIRRRFWTGELSTSELVPTTLIYADLLASGDPRQLEAATRLRETDELLQYLDRN